MMFCCLKWEVIVVVLYSINSILKVQGQLGPASGFPSCQPTIRPTPVPTTTPTVLSTPAPTFSAVEYLTQSTFASTTCTNTPLSTIVYVLNVCSLGSTFQFLTSPITSYAVATYSFKADGLIVINVNQYAISDSTCSGAYTSSTLAQLSSTCNDLGVIYSYSGTEFPTLSTNQAQQTIYFLSTVCASNSAFQYHYQYSGQCSSPDSDGLSYSSSCSGGGNFIQNNYIGTSCQGSPQVSTTATVLGCLKQQTGNLVYYLNQQCSSGTSVPAVVATSVLLVNTEQPDSFEFEQQPDRGEDPADSVATNIIGTTTKHAGPGQVDDVMEGELVSLRSLSTDDRLNPTIAPTKAPSGFGSLGYLMVSTVSSAQCIGSITAITAYPAGVCINGAQSSSIYVYTAAPGNTASGGQPYVTLYKYSTFNCIGTPSPGPQIPLNSCAGGTTYSFSNSIQFPSGGYITESYYQTSTCSGIPYETIWRPFVPCSAETLLNSGSGYFYGTTSASSNGLTTTYYATSLCSGTVVATSTIELQSSCIVTVNNGTTSIISQSVSTSLYSTQSSANAAAGLSTGGAVGIAIACVVIVAGAVAVAIYFNYTRLFGSKAASQETAKEAFGVNAETQVATQPATTTSALHEPLV